MNPNVDRAIIRFVEKQVPELLQKFEEIVKILDKISIVLKHIEEDMPVL